MDGFYDPLDQAANAKAAKESAEQAKREAESIKADLRWLMSEKRGRRIMRWVLGWCGVHRSSFNTNTAVMAFQEGGRNVGLFLTDRLKDAGEKQFFLMLSEESNERTEPTDGS
jgi:hypothetical protein